MGSDPPDPSPSENPQAEKTHAHDGQDQAAHHDDDPLMALLKTSEEPPENSTRTSPASQETESITPTQASHFPVEACKSIDQRDEQVPPSPSDPILVEDDDPDGDEEMIEVSPYWEKEPPRQGDAEMALVHETGKTPSKDEQDEAKEQQDTAMADAEQPAEQPPRTEDDAITNTHNPPPAMTEQPPRHRSETPQAQRSRQDTMPPPPMPPPVSRRAPSRFATPLPQDEQASSRNLRDESPLFMPRGDGEHSGRNTAEPPTPVMGRRELDRRHFERGESIRGESPLFMPSRAGTMEPQLEPHPAQGSRFPFPFLAVPGNTRAIRAVSTESSLFVDNSQSAQEPVPRATPETSLPAISESRAESPDQSHDEPHDEGNEEGSDQANNDVFMSGALGQTPLQGEDSLSNTDANVQPPPETLPNIEDGPEQIEERRRIEMLITDLEAPSQPPAPAPTQSQRKRKRNPPTSTPRAPHESQAGDGDNDGNSSSSSTPGLQNDDNMGWMRRAAKTSLGLRKRNRNARRARPRGSRPPSVASSSSSSRPARGAKMAYGLDVTYGASKFEMPTRNDFVKPFATLNIARFRWGAPTEEPELPSGTQIFAPPPRVPDPMADSGDEFRRPNTFQSRSRLPPREKAKPAAIRPVVEHRRGYIELLPPEVREGIFSELLVDPQPIFVYKGWTMVCRQSRDTPLAPESVLYPAILSTCKTFFEEGKRVLYGENTFRYRLRDPPGRIAPPPVDIEALAHSDSFNPEEIIQYDDQIEDESGSEYNEDEEAGVETRRSSRRRRRPSSSSEGHINIEKYMPFIRHITLDAEQNRTSRDVMEAMAEAIEVFCEREPVQQISDKISDKSLQKRSKKKPNKSPATAAKTAPAKLESNIHTLNIVIHPSSIDNHVNFTFVDFFVGSSPVIRAMKHLRPQFIKINIMSLFLNGGRRKNRRLHIDLRPQRIFSRVKASGEDEWAKDRLMRRARLIQVNLSNKVLNELSDHVRACCQEYAEGQEPRRGMYYWFDEFQDEDDLVEHELEDDELVDHEPVDDNLVDE